MNTGNRVKLSQKLKRGNVFFSFSLMKSGSKINNMKIFTLLIFSLSTGKNISTNLIADIRDLF